MKAIKAILEIIKENKEVISLSTVIVCALIFFLSAYTVDETEQVVITQFGRVIGIPKVEPGLYFRMPILQHINKFPKNLQEWDGDPGQIPTLDKTYIWVDTFARWRIVDPVKFFQTVNNTLSALGRLDDIIDPAVRNFITSYPLIETVRQTNRKMDTFEIGMDESNERHIGTIKVGREKITEGIQKQARPKLLEFGIELVDVKIKRVNYVEQVRESVYGRMIAERKQIAEKFRSEGQGEARKILGKKERELKRITSEAYKTAQEIMGQADAQAISIYANAYEKDPDFYSFVKTLDNYGATINKDTSLILSTDAEYLKYFKGYSVK
ncbi:MAG: Protein hflC [Candidatus Magnetoglobus multicellularis str. Araruama]|uniref:Protein HflC n=1 Tax=Candidatus Magnetoglobus multicellularis str. Araruama TaxID=890399 RepID=A0A1V1PHN7_9BACT|nr:MAG: Protein hflC [Candidatus Magnetoglobus multicellularis str. Araruama]